MEGEDRTVAVSPRHTVVLAAELFALIEQAPRHDFVVRTLIRREAGGLPLMTAELVIASGEVRAAHAAAATYPLHFRKTYFPGRMHADPQVEFDHHLLASRLSTVPPPIGHAPSVFRSCLIPGQPYARLSPFGASPPESNITEAQNQPLAAVAGLWRLAEGMLAQLSLLHQGGLAHGDAELHNCIVCPSPLEPLWIDFESAVRRDGVEESAWLLRCEQDLAPLLREAIYLQCALGPQPSALGQLSRGQLDRLFERPDPFRRAIDGQTRV
jgi:hypothetical protein